MEFHMHKSLCCGAWAQQIRNWNTAPPEKTFSTRPWPDLHLILNGMLHPNVRMYTSTPPYAFTTSCLINYALTRKSLYFSCMRKKMKTGFWLTSRNLAQRVKQLARVCKWSCAHAKVGALAVTRRRCATKWAKSGSSPASFGFDAAQVCTSSVAHGLFPPYEVRDSPDRQRSWPKENESRPHHKDEWGYRSTCT
jgi:hypothetical protein